MREKKYKQSMSKKKKDAAKDGKVVQKSAHGGFDIKI